MGCYMYVFCVGVFVNFRHMNMLFQMKFVNTNVVIHDLVHRVGPHLACLLYDKRVMRGKLQFTVFQTSRIYLH